MRTLLAILALAPAASQEAPRPARMFGDHMVLQRDVQVPVWGWAAAGERITVRMGDRSADAVADPNGKWIAKIGPFPAGGPHTLTVSGKASVEIKDVLVGDVWVCSGQSNMEWPLSMAMNAQREIAEARNPRLRHFAVPKKISPRPLADMTGGAWQECRPETVGGWTAVGYFFGRHLQEKAGVPIGLVHASWGGTVCESWASAEALKTIADFKPAVEVLESSIGRLPELEKAYQEALAVWKRRFEDLDQASKGWSDPSFDASAWKTMALPAHWENAGLPNLDGVVWFRREVALTAPWSGRELTLSLGPIDDSDVTYFNGSPVGKTHGWQASRTYKVPGALVKPGANVIAVKVTDTGGGGGLYGKADQMKLEGPGPAIPLGGAWAYAVGIDLAKTDPKPAPPPFSENPNTPTALYNGMIAPILPYGIKGAIWYQGESNVGRAKQYRELFPAMIRDWRSRWGAGDFPFLFVQLANFLPAKAEPGESAWAELREAQELALAMPNTGQSVIIDIGDAADIHPRNKQDVGRRLATWALGTTYGERIEPSGPLYAGMSVEGKRIRVKFTHAGGGLVAKGGGALQAFAISGSDRKWVWAEARIDGESVVVWSEAVAKPVAVRYAWADNPEGCNLTNKEGLPASPFRTDR